MKTITKTQFSEVAWNIGCQLMQDSIWHNDACNWLGYWVQPYKGKYVPQMTSFGPDIYSGTAGIALFLSALYAESEDSVILKTINGTVQQIRATMATAPNHGFYSGKPGIGATLIKLGTQFSRTDWMKDGEHLLNSIPVKISGAHEIDLISGAAGTIPALLDAYQITSNESLLQKANELGLELIKNGVEFNNTMSWTTVPGKQNLTGFSHGASGIALALLKLYEVTNNQAFLTASQGGFNYERSTFDSKQQNWPDFRADIDAKDLCGLAWCHGAPGIALSRIEALQIQPDESKEVELKIALNTTARSINNMLLNIENANFSLCHGIAGNADILLSSKEKEFKDLAEVVGDIGIKMYHNHNRSWPTGLNSQHNTPGLMMGAAGTGYFYLRLSNPKKYKTLLIPGIKF